MNDYTVRVRYTDRGPRGEWTEEYEVRAPDAYVAVARAVMLSGHGTWVSVMDVTVSPTEPRP